MILSRRSRVAAAALLVAPLLAPAAEQSPVTAGNTTFALELYRKVRVGAGNVFFSPLSISEALAMAWAGARGETARQMAAVLHLPAAEAEVHEGFRAVERRIAAIQAGGKADIAVANSLWPQEGEPMRPRYLTLLKSFYGAAPTPVDYRRSPDGARTTINRWVESRTRDRIRNLLPSGSVDATTRLVLVNAIYFKGKWKSRFDKALTKSEPFRSARGKSSAAPLMHGTLKAGYLAADVAEVLRLPYQGDDLSLVVVLPKELDGLAALEDRLTADRLAGWLATMGAAQKVEVTLPRFRMDYGFTLKGKLVSMGMGEAFDPSKASFEGMSASRPGFYIGEGFHKAFVDVNEEGTEAAAATALTMIPASMPAPPPVFRADHPFLFLIRDDVTGAVLFLGRVIDPS